MVGFGVPVGESFKVEFAVRTSDHHRMQTTLDLDDDVLAAAEEISALTHRSAGKVLSDLARRALTVSKPSDSFPPAVYNGFEIIPADKIASYMMSSASALERVENQIQSIHEGKYVDSIDDRIDELRLLNMFFSYAFQKEHPQKRLSDHQISVNYNSSSENFCRFNNFSIVACLGFQKFIDKWKENILDEVNFYHIVQAAQMLQSRVETLDDFGLYTRDPGLIQKAQEEHQQLIRTLELITSLNE